MSTTMPAESKTRPKGLGNHSVAPQQHSQPGSRRACISLPKIRRAVFPPASSILSCFQTVSSFKRNLVGQVSAARASQKPCKGENVLCVVSPCYSHASRAGVGWSKEWRCWRSMKWRKIRFHTVNLILHVSLKPPPDTSTHIHTDTFDAMYCQQVKDGLNFTKLSNP